MCHQAEEMLHSVALASYLCQPLPHSWCPCTPILQEWPCVSLLCPSMLWAEVRFPLSARYARKGRSWSMWSVTALPPLFPIILWLYKENVQVAVWDPYVKRQVLSYNPQMGKPSSNPKLCESDEESQFVSYKCVFGNMGRKPMTFPTVGLTRAVSCFGQASFFSLQLTKPQSGK